MELVPRLEKLDKELEELSLVRRTRVAFDWVLGDKLRAVEKLELCEIVRDKMKLARASTRLEMSVHEHPMNGIDRLEVHSNLDG